MTDFERCNEITLCDLWILHLLLTPTLLNAAVAAAQHCTNITSCAVFDFYITIIKTVFAVRTCRI